MSVNVQIAAILRSRCGGKSSFAVEGSSIRELVDAINSEFPDFAESMLEPDGSMKESVLISINGELLPPGVDSETAVIAGDKVFFLSAFAGG